MPAPTPTAASLVVDLQSAAKAMNADTARDTTERLVDLVRHDAAALSPADAYVAAKCLRKKRMFAALDRLLDVYLRFAASPTPLLRTLHAQALIDQDRLEAARDVLERVLREAPADSKAAEEARGLVGRIHKQAFVAAAATGGGADALRLAVEAYADAFACAVHDPFWPGINLVALVMRARADRVSVPERSDPVALARDLLARAVKQLDADRAAAAEKGEDPADQPWLVATALEASLALDDAQATVAWGNRYLACRGADAFELGSTHRQLTEIWRLHRRGGLAATFVPMLEGELLRNKPGALVTGAIGAQSVTVAAEQEAVWGAERFKNYRWIVRAVRSAESVAQVKDASGAAIGTGFLLAGEDLSPAWSRRTVLLTNRHVIDCVKPANGVACANARIHFTQPGRSPEGGFRVSPALLWRSPDAPVELDCVVLELLAGKGPAAEAVPPPATTIEVGDRANLQPEGERIYIIGHPGGRDLSYSLYDNALVAIEPPLLYYRSPTEGGSSGSPVFDAQWQLVAIHHSHVDARTANRGTFIDAVREAIAGDGPGRTPCRSSGS